MSRGTRQASNSRASGQSSSRHVDDTGTKESRTSLGELIDESFEVEEAAGKIQQGDQVGLSPADIEEIVRHYDDWYARCLSVLPETFRGKFEAEYVGKWHAPAIKRFLEQPTAPNPLHTPESQALVPHWLFPYESTFRTPIRAQRQILREVEVRQAPFPGSQAAGAQDHPLGVDRGSVFIAMPMSQDDPMLDDVHDAIKQVATELGMRAERVDDPHTTARITDRIRHQLARAEYVVADLTHAKPNVYYEAGYADALGKTPIYIAREGTHVEFDVKDYPVLFFSNLRQLKTLLSARLQGLSKSSGLE